MRVEKIHYQRPIGTPDELRQILEQYFNPAPILPEADLQSDLRGLPLVDMPVRAGAIQFNKEELGQGKRSEESVRNHLTDPAL